MGGRLIKGAEGASKLLNQEAAGRLAGEGKGGAVMREARQSDTCLQWPSQVDAPVRLVPPAALPMPALFPRRPGISL